MTANTNPSQDLVCAGPQLLLHPSAAHKAGCPLCNPNKAFHELNAAAGEARASNERVERLLAAALAHRGCCGTEHDPANGKLHGNCVVCGIPWPCDTAKEFLVTPDETKEQRTPFRKLQKLASDYADGKLAEPLNGWKKIHRSALVVGFGDGWSQRELLSLPVETPDE